MFFSNPKYNEEVSSLRLNLQVAAKRNIVVISGVTGIGKSYLAKKVFPKAQVLDFDSAYRSKLQREYYDQPDDKNRKRYTDIKVDLVADGHDVITSENGLIIENCHVLSPISVARIINDARAIEAPVLVLAQMHQDANIILGDREDVTHLSLDTFCQNLEEAHKES